METKDAAPEKITGYQWGDDNRFIGPYVFDNNADKEEIHLPPCTTLEAPPIGMGVDEEAAWDAATGGWIVRRIAMSHLPDREVPHVD